MVDKRLFFWCIVLITIGIMASLSLPSFSVLYVNKTKNIYFFKQLISGFLGIFVIWLIAQIESEKKLKILLFSIFIISFLSMGLLPFLPDSLSVSKGGAQRWITLPFFSIAPVEFFKIGFVFFLAWSFNRKIKENNKSLKQELIAIWPYSLLLLFVVAAILIFQNDFGQTIVLISTFIILLVMAGSSFKIFFMAIITILSVGIAGISFSEVRLLRIKKWWILIQDSILEILPSQFSNFLKVEDIEGSFQIIQSTNTIYNGGLFGEGIGSGIMKLGFLSEVHTDFVISGLTEEIGSLLFTGITVLYLYIIYRILQVAKFSENKMYFLFCVGIALLLFFSFIINAFGILGLIPIKGIAVPFLSYGGSSLLANCIAIGLVLAIGKQRGLKKLKAKEKS